jgi:retron-type reverse transcriptase
LFEELVSTENLFTAWALFRRGKRRKVGVRAFEHNLEENLFELQAALENGSYRPEAYRSFRVNDPKSRVIHAAAVRDRVAHQALVNVVEPVFETRFIHDSYSCRVGKGTHEAVKRLREFLRRASRNDTRTVYALKCDVRRFFASIDHGILLLLLERRLGVGRTLCLCQSIIESHETAVGKGLPLGNVTSQLFANAYLNELDRFIKHELREKFYLRYCDDFIIVDHDRKRLIEMVRPIGDFLRKRLLLELHPTKVSVRSWTQGIDFLGYVTMPKATVMRPVTTRRAVRLVSPENLPSYLGMCSHADAYELGKLLRTLALS